MERKSTTLTVGGRIHERGLCVGHGTRLGHTPEVRLGESVSLFISCHGCLAHELVDLELLGSEGGEGGGVVEVIHEG